MEENPVNLRIVYRVLFVMFLAVMSLRTFAQTEVGISINSAEFDTVTLVEESESITLDFDEGIGIGLSFNHYWTDAFSTELAAHSFRADMTIEADDLPVFEAGEISAAAITGMGQFHFNRAGRFSPYAGAGIAFISGEFDANPEFEDPSEPDSDGFKLETETTWTAGVGADIRITERLILNLDVRYLRWSATPELEDEEDEIESLDVDPMLFSAGIKFRF